MVADEVAIVMNLFSLKIKQRLNLRKRMSSQIKVLSYRIKFALFCCDILHNDVLHCLFCSVYLTSVYNSVYRHIVQLP